MDENTLARLPPRRRDESQHKNGGDEDDGMHIILAAAIGLTSLGAPGAPPAAAAGQKESAVAPSKKKNEEDDEGSAVGTRSIMAEAIGPSKDKETADGGAAAVVTAATAKAHAARPVPPPPNHDQQEHQLPFSRQPHRDWRSISAAAAAMPPSFSAAAAAMPPSSSRGFQFQLTQQHQLQQQLPPSHYATKTVHLPPAYASHMFPNYPNLLPQQSSHSRTNDFALPPSKRQKMIQKKLPSTVGTGLATGMPFYFSNNSVGECSQGSSIFHGDDSNMTTGLLTLNFPEILYEIMTNTNDYCDILSWLPHGRGFTIHDKTLFTHNILPRHFDNAKFTSFTRRLKRWNFRRVSRGPEMGSYYNKFFIRGRPDLVTSMMYGVEDGMMMENEDGTMVEIEDGDEGDERLGNNTDESEKTRKTKEKQQSQGENQQKQKQKQGEEKKKKNDKKKKSQEEMDDDDAVVAAAMEDHRRKLRMQPQQVQQLSPKEELDSSPQRSVNDNVSVACVIEAHQQMIASAIKSETNDDDVVAVAMTDHRRQLRKQQRQMHQLSSKKEPDISYRSQQASLADPVIASAIKAEIDDDIPLLLPLQSHQRKLRKIQELYSKQELDISYQRSVVDNASVASDIEAHQQVLLADPVMASAMKAQRHKLQQEEEKKKDEKKTQEEIDDDAVVAKAMEDHQQKLQMQQLSLKKKMDRSYQRSIYEDAVVSSDIEAHQQVLLADPVMASAIKAHRQKLQIKEQRKKKSEQKKKQKSQEGIDDDAVVEAAMADHRRKLQMQQQQMQQLSSKQKLDSSYHRSLDENASVASDIEAHQQVLLADPVMASAIKAHRQKLQMQHQQHSSNDVEFNIRYQEEMERLRQQDQAQQRQIFLASRQGSGCSSPEKQIFSTPSHNLGDYSSLRADSMSNIMTTRYQNAMQVHQRQEQLELMQLRHQSELMQLQSTNESSGNNTRVLMSNKQLQCEKPANGISDYYIQARSQRQGVQQQKLQQQHESPSPKKKQKALPKMLNNSKDYISMMASRKISEMERAEMEMMTTRCRNMSEMEMASAQEYHNSISSATTTSASHQRMHPKFPLADNGQHHCPNDIERQMATRRRNMAEMEMTLAQEQQNSISSTITSTASSQRTAPIIISPPDSVDHQQCLNGIERQIMSEMSYPLLPSGTAAAAGPQSRSPSSSTGYKQRTNSNNYHRSSGSANDNNRIASYTQRSRNISNVMTSSDHHRQDANVTATTPLLTGSNNLQMNNSDFVADQDMIKKILSSSETHEGIMMMAARGLHTSAGSTKVGQHQHQMTPLKQPPQQQQQQPAHTSARSLQSRAGNDVGLHQQQHSFPRQHQQQLLQQHHLPRHHRQLQQSSPVSPATSRYHAMMLRQLEEKLEKESSAQQVAGLM